MKNKLQKLLPIAILLFGLFLANSCNNTKTSAPPITLATSTEILFNPKLTYGTITDIDGNSYRTINIGKQTWMAENLKVTHYRNGDAIPNVTDSAAWSNLTTGAYCNYNNDVNNVGLNGRLYNWFAVTDNRNIAPKGWHIPSTSEWIILTTYLGGEENVAPKLKEAGKKHWVGLHKTATNESGFTALPAGARVDDGRFTDESENTKGIWWCSAILKSNFYFDVFILNLNNSGYVKSGNIMDDGKDTQKSGFSIRCVKD